MLIVGVSKFCVPENMRIMRNWTISGQGVGIARPRVPISARKAAFGGLFSMVCFSFEIK